MAKNHSKISDRERSLISKSLEKTTSNFSGDEAVKHFIESVLTDGERMTIGRRITIAQLILQGRTYYEVNELLQVSPNTFSKIRRWVAEQMPKYESILKEEKIRQKESKTDSTTKLDQTTPFSLEKLKKTYPMHFLLLNLFDNKK